MTGVGAQRMESERHQVHVFPARTSALTDIAALATRVGARAGLSRNASLRLVLLVEELFTNTIAHGHGQDSDEPVRLDFDITPGRVALTYEDTGPAHDPFADVALPEAAADVEKRPVGGLGVVLIAGMAQDVEYRRVEGRNRISLVISG